ncbi:MAG: adhesin, partial [Eggerthellaceae bacterium]|nr:adhesin [Eggerthellaceae bacterium]
AATADGEDIAIYEETIEAAESGQNAGLATNGGKLDLAHATLVKSGDDTDGDRCNFYGANAIVLAANEASLAIVSDSALTASSEGSNGLFATDKATIFANNTTIETTANSARGLDATYGGTIVANGLTISTQGDHCASIATDRGGGNISVANSTLSTAGSGSPILYSTGDIEVDNVTGTSTNSQLVGMEGLNSVLISDSKLTSTNKGKTGSDPVANGVLIYQSTSGDAEAKTGETALFQATNSKLSSAIESGAMFYLTNTSAKVVLSNTELDFDSDAANLITAAGNDANNWGTAGSNGAIATFTGINQDLEGNVEVDTISTVDFFLLDGSTWEGASDIVDNAKASTNAEHLNVYIDSTSEWIVTDDSTVSNLNLAKGGKLVDKQGKAVKVADADGNVLVEGASDIMVYVNDVFSTSVSTTEANAIEAADIDRSAFDEMFGITTTFGENGNAALGTTDEEQEVEATKQAIIDWFHNL